MYLEKYSYCYLRFSLFKIWYKILLESHMKKENEVEENEVAKSVNAMDNDFSKSKESLVEDLWTFKKSFFVEVSVFKHQLLTSYATNKEIK